MISSRGLCVGVALLLGMAAVAAGAISVPLTVTERAGVTRTNEVAAGGVPMPRGAVKDTKDFGVVDADGKPVPAQFTILNRWPSDGSIRWMLVEFAVNIGPRETKTFTLREGVANPKPKAALSIGQTDDEIEIGSDAWRGPWGDLIFKKGGFLAGTGGTIVLETTSGKRYSTSADEQGTVTFEDVGPLRATMRFDGRHKDPKGESLLAYRVRATVYADRRAVRIQYTFTHDRGSFTDEPVKIKSLVLNLSVWGKGNIEARVGGARSDHVAKLKKGDVLRQAFLADDSYALTGALTGGGATRSAESGHVGWCALTDREEGTGSAAVRWCWQLRPKAFTLSGDGSLKVELIPPDASEPTSIYRGMSKTHDLLLVMSPDAKLAREAAIGFQQPLFVKCPPSWYCEDTLGFGRLLSVGSKHLPEQLAGFDKRVAEGFEEQMRVIRSSRARIVDRKRGVNSYGMMHFGDGFHNYTGSGHRALEWDNCYYSYTHLLAMQYARSGSDAILDTLREAAMFEGDVAIGWTTLDRAGPRQNPGKYHVGGFGRFDNHNSGTWSFYKPVGMMQAFFLTGDRRYQDAGLANSNWTLTNDGYDMYNNPRSAGAGLRACVHGYLATGNEDFLHVARDVARKAERFYRVHGHFAPIRNSIFMCANALAGLCAYHDLTGDERLGKILPAMIKAHVDTFNRNPASIGYAYMSLYAARLSGDAAWRSQVEEALADKARFGVRSGDHHVKDFASSKREVPRIFWYLSDLAGTPPRTWGRVDLGPDRPDRLEVPRSRAPELDGTLGPNEWAKTAPIDLVSSPSVNRRPKQPTRLQLGWDRENLYLAVHATEPRLDLLKVDVKEDGGRTYGDDCVEIYVGPNRRLYGTKLVVNAAGVRMTGARGHQRGTHPAAPPAAFPVKAGRQKNAWILEVVIPWDKIGITDPRPGTEVALNVLRFRMTRGPDKPGETSTWHGTSNQMESVGTLVLKQ